MKFLHIMRTVDPESGGPIEALVRSEPTWRRHGHSRTIASLDCPGDEAVRRCPIPVVPLGSPLTRRMANVVPLARYRFTAAMIPWLRAHTAEYDAVVVNGVWNYAAWAASRVLPQAGIPYFVFTHGMLDPYFRRAHPLKHWAKQMSWWLVEEPLMRDAATVLFTSAGEAHAAQGAFWPYRFRWNVCGYGTDTPPHCDPAQAAAWRQRVPDLHSKPYLLFLGRLHPKKGCDLLIEAFAQHAGRRPDLRLVIAGPDTDGWAAELKALAAQRGIADRILWPGMLSGDTKWGALRGCEAFILPSHGENFGMAVVEAMACGRPVLISDRVNIAPEIEADRAGLVAPDTRAGTVALISDFLGLDKGETAAMGERARLCFEQNFDIERVATQMLAILTGAIAPRSAARFEADLRKNPEILAAKA